MLITVVAIREMSGICPARAVLTACLGDISNGSAVVVNLSPRFEPLSRSGNASECSTSAWVNFWRMTFFLETWGSPLHMWGVLEKMAISEGHRMSLWKKRDTPVPEGWVSLGGERQTAHFLCAVLRDREELGLWSEKRWVGSRVRREVGAGPGLVR